MRVGVLRICFRIPGASSLKEKRMVVRSLKDRLVSRFNVSVAEIGSNDKWQIGEIGVALIGTDSRFVDSSIQKVRNFVLQDPRISLIEDAVDFI